MSSALLLFASALSACLSMALFRHVLSGRIAWQGSLLALIKDAFALLTQPLFLLGLVGFATATTLWLVVLATQKLSVAYPVQIGLVTLFTGVVSMTIFKETIPLRGYAGYGLLLAGVLLIFW